MQQYFDPEAVKERFITNIAEYVREINRLQPRTARRLINTISDTISLNDESRFRFFIICGVVPDVEDDYESEVEDDYEPGVEDEDIPDLILDDLSDLGDYDYMPDLENDDGTIHVGDDEKDG